MKLHQIHDSSNKFVMDLLETEFYKIKNKNLLQNYHPDSKNYPGNLFYILTDNNGRYRKGCYYVLEDQGSFVASAGYNQYDFDDTIALISRAYVSPKYRTNYHLAEYILPKIIESTKNFKKLYITFNIYNKIIYDGFVRMSQSKKTGIHDNWPDIYKKFKPIGKQIIYYTEQYVVEYQS